MLLMPYTYINAIASVMSAPRKSVNKNHVGARHQHVIGEDENVITAVPRPHAIAQCHVPGQRAIASCPEERRSRLMLPGHGNRDLFVSIGTLWMPCPYDTGQVVIFDNLCYVFIARQDAIAQIM